MLSPVKKSRFLSIAKGSAGEVRSLLSVVHAVGYIDFKTFWQLRNDALSVSKMLGHHMKQLERRIIATEKKNALTVRHRQKNTAPS